MDDGPPAHLLAAARELQAKREAEQARAQAAQHQQRAAMAMMVAHADFKASQKMQGMSPTAHVHHGHGVSGGFPQQAAAPSGPRPVMGIQATMPGQPTPMFGSNPQPLTATTAHAMTHSMSSQPTAQGHAMQFPGPSGVAAPSGPSPMATSHLQGPSPHATSSPQATAPLPPAGGVPSALPSAVPGRPHFTDLFAIERSIRETLYGEVLVGKHRTTNTTVVVKVFHTQLVAKRCTRQGYPVAENAVDEVATRHNTRRVCARVACHVSHAPCFSRFAFTST